MESVTDLTKLQDDNEPSKRMQETWDNEKVASCCSENACVAVRLHSRSEQGIQFASCFVCLVKRDSHVLATAQEFDALSVTDTTVPFQMIRGKGDALRADARKSRQSISESTSGFSPSVPSTYLINAAGVPTDIIPGYLPPDEFYDKVKKTVLDNITNQKTTDSLSTSTPQPQETPSFNEDESKAEEPVTAENSLYQDIPDLEEDESLNRPSFVQDSDEFRQRVDRAQELIKQTQIQKEKKEQEDEKIRERNRRRVGQEIAKAKKDRSDRQARQWADELAKKKAEEKAAREAVREQIRRDQAEKASRFEAEKEENRKQREMKRARAEEEKTTIPPSERTSTRLQFRLPDGSNSTQEFPADKKLRNVIEFVLQHVCPKCDDVKLATVYPRHEFQDDELDSTLRELNLVPNAALIVIPVIQKIITAGNNSGILEFIMLLLSPIFALVTWLKSLFVGDSSNSTSETSTKQSQSVLSGSRRETRGRTIAKDSSTYRRQGNVHKFKQDDEDDEDKKTWNGNSTQQM